MVAVYCATMGPSGLRKVAELSYHKAHYLAQAINELPGWSVANSSGETFFNEFPVECPIDPSQVNKQLADLGITVDLTYRTWYQKACSSAQRR